MADGSGDRRIVGGSAGAAVISALRRTVPVVGALAFAAPGDGAVETAADPEVADPAVADPEVADPEVADPEVPDPAVPDPAVPTRRAPAPADPAAPASAARAERCRPAAICSRAPDVGGSKTGRVPAAARFLVTGLMG